MKKYLKPVLNLNKLKFKEKISTLNDWLAGAGNEYADAGITTYTIES